MVTEYNIIILNYPSKLEVIQENSTSTEKTVTNPGFEPGTSGIAVASHDHEKR
jgi:hypothetical protein